MMISPILLRSMPVPNCSLPHLDSGQCPCGVHADAQWTQSGAPRRVLERIIHANVRRIYGNVQRMRALPAPALVVHREVNDEARSGRYRKRWYFGCDPRGGDRECTVLSPLRPCSNLHLACLYPQIRGSVRREGVLRTPPFADPNSPEATGGGSLGYNRALPHWWDVAGFASSKRWGMWAFSRPPQAGPRGGGRGLTGATRRAGDG